MMPSETTGIAHSFAEVALSDSRSAVILHSRREYPQACYLLQQSVEKSAKAFGLIMCLVKIDELKVPVGHLSMLALTQHFKEYVERNRPQLTSILEVINGTRQKPRPAPWTKRQVWKSLQNPRLLPSLKKVEQLLSLFDTGSVSGKVHDDLEGKDRQMWEASLNLDVQTELVGNAIKRLEEEKKMEPRLLILLLRAVRTFGAPNMSLRDAAYLLGLYRVAWRIGPLSFLTMWHEKTTRYPRVTNGDYGSPFDYVEDTPYVKKFLLLNRHARTCAEELLGSFKLMQGGGSTPMDNLSTRSREM